MIMMKKHTFNYACAKYSILLLIDILLHNTDSTLRDDLQWLPVPARIVFKLSTIIFKCLHQTTPQYLQELCVPVTASTSHRHLCSATGEDLQVLVCRMSRFGPRSCAACTPKIICHHHFVIQLTLFCSRLDNLPFGPWLCTRDCLGCKSGTL